MPSAVLGPAGRGAVELVVEDVAACAVLEEEDDGFFVVAERGMVEGGGILHVDGVDVDTFGQKKLKGVDIAVTRGDFPDLGEDFGVGLTSEELFQGGKIAQGDGNAGVGNNAQLQEGFDGLMLLVGDGGVKALGRVGATSQEDFDERGLQVGFTRNIAGADHAQGTADVVGSGSGVDDGSGDVRDIGWKGVVAGGVLGDEAEEAGVGEIGASV